MVGLAAIVALYYGLGHLNWYFGTPLGRVPVLDERENLDLATAIFKGTLPAEPFYRAPGYALLLSLIRVLGIPPQGLFPAALLLGVALHGTGAALAASTAGRWFGNPAALIAGLFYALDPVLVHFATQALDATLGLTLFLAGLRCFSGAIVSPGRATAWGWAGIFWAMATLVRPNYLLAWALVPAFAALQPIRWRWRSAVILASLAGVVLFAAQSAWQRRLSGSPGFLPWQGSYNLWAANRPGSNGRYYTQRISLTPLQARANPARSESEILYSQETGEPAGDIARMNAHWRARFIEEITTHPLRWMRLAAIKAYALVNNWEQYNNKSYAFHKERSPWLRWNPIGWGLLFVLAVAGGSRLAFSAPRVATGLACVAAAIGLSVLLFFASARFRLPLAGICAILAGGALGSPSFWKGLSRKWLIAVAAMVVAAAIVAFSRFGSIADTSTFVQDHVLLARASFSVGDDQQAIREANEALLLQPWHPDAQAIIKAARDDIEARKDGP